MSFQENKDGNKFASLANKDELKGRNELRSLAHMFDSLVGDVEWVANNSFLFTNRQMLSRILYFDQLYRLLLNTPGVICEFGVQYGANLALLSNLRGIYEPYNYTRKIIGFDTFDGFVDDLNQDEKDLGWNVQDYSVPKKYEEFLDEVLSVHQSNSPVAHIDKFELVKGDVKETVDIWLKNNQHIVVGMAIFDMDVYSPTKYVLEKILDVMPKGGVLVFDELNHELFPGETQAVNEVLGISNLKLQCNANNPTQAWCIIE